MTYPSRSAQPAFERDTDETPVLFRKHIIEGDITAVFPTIAADQHAGYLMTCYAHIGQHAACTKEWYFTTRPAKPAEYADLKAELEGAPYGYRLKVCSRITRAMDDERRDQSRQ